MLKAVMTLVLVFAACSPIPSVSPSDTDTSPSPAAASPIPGIDSIPDGEHRVGVDVQPGTYRALKVSANPAEDFCYWERLSGFGGTEAETIANNAGVGPRVVAISASDAAFRSEGCGRWTSALSVLPGPIGDGVWIVGSDLRPGRYHSEGGAACIWQRLSGFGGTSDDSLAVGMAGEVEILASDVGFSSSHCGEWLPATT